MVGSGLMTGKSAAGSQTRATPINHPLVGHQEFRDLAERWPASACRLHLRVRQRTLAA